MLVAKALADDAYATPGQKQGRQSKVSPLPHPRTYLIVLGGCLILFMANAVLHGFVTVSSAKVEALTAQLTNAEQEAERKELEIAYLASYPRIAREAESQLAMHAPGPSELHFVAMANPIIPSTDRRVTHTQNMTLASSLGNWLRGLGRAAASTN